jgi:hypothetical protein
MIGEIRPSQRNSKNSQTGKIVKWQKNPKSTQKCKILCVRILAQYKNVHDAG